MRLLLLGSSIMQGWSDALASFPGHQVVNRAIGGTTAAQWRGWIAEHLAAGPCDRVLLYCGSNDLNAGATAEGVIGDVLAIRATLARLRPGLPLAWLTVMRCPQKLPRWADIDRINATVAAGLPACDRVVDLNAVLATADVADPRYQEDALHLTAAGYADFAAQVRRDLAGWI